MNVERVKTAQLMSGETMHVGTEQCSPFPHGDDIKTMVVALNQLKLAIVESMNECGNDISLTAYAERLLAVSKSQRRHVSICLIFGMKPQRTRCSHIRNEGIVKVR